MYMYIRVSADRQQTGIESAEHRISDGSTLSFRRLTGKGPKMARGGRATRIYT